MLTQLALKIRATDGCDGDKECAVFQMELLPHIGASLRYGADHAQPVIVPLIIAIPHLEAHRPGTRKNNMLPDTYCTQ